MGSTIDVRIALVSRAFETVIKIATLVIILLIIGGSTAIIPASADTASQDIFVSTSPSGLNPQPTIEHEGQNITVTAQPVAGYVFQKWVDITDDVSMPTVSTSASYSFIAGNNSYIRLEAVYSPVPPPYTISVSTSPSDLNPQPTGGGTYDNETTAIVTAQTVTGYTFQNWTENGDLVSTDASYQFTVTGNRSLVAEYSPQNQYKISVSTLPSSLNPQPTGGGTYPEGQTVTVTAQPVAGYTFQKWTENGDLVSTDASYQFTVTGDRNLVAEYNFSDTPIPTRYTVSVSISPSDLTPQPTGEGTYLEGQTVIVTAQSVIGYTFQKWTENGDLVSTDASYQFTVSGNRSLVAEYLPMPTTPTSPTPTSPTPTTPPIVTPTVSPIPTVIPTPPNSGSISVSSFPSGASIYLDGSYRGTTPSNLIGVTAGSHEIKLILIGFEDWSQKVDIVADKTLYVPAQLAPSSIIFIVLGLMIGTLTIYQIRKHRIRKMPLKKYWEKMREWEKEGYDITELKEIDRTGKMKEEYIGFIKNNFKEFETEIKKLNKFGKELDSLDAEGFEIETKAIKSMLKSPDKVTVIEKGIKELKEKIEKRSPDLSVNRNTSEVLTNEGGEIEVKIELKNDGDEIARSVSLSDRINNGLKIISGENSWTGDINQHASKVFKYTIKADNVGRYTIPSLIVNYKDKRGKIFEKTATPIEINVIPKAEIIPKMKTTSTMENPPKNAYGVIIGIGRYKDPGIPTLKYAKDDALEIYNILTDPAHGNFPKENVKLLLDEQATLTEIKSAMGTFLARKAGEDDVVCIYFAGHGSPEIDPARKADDRLEKFIVPYDAQKDDLFSYGLPMDTIRDIYDRIESKRIIFFIDSCYSGDAGGRTFSRSDIKARNISISEKFLEQLSGEGRIIITASKPDELSLETDEFKHGIFTYYLAEGLKGKADLNKDGVVTIDELYRYVYDNVSQKARLLGSQQHPLKKGTFIGEIPLTCCEA